MYFGGLVTFGFYQHSKRRRMLIDLNRRLVAVEMLLQGDDAKKKKSRTAVS
jgi:hypothetical protein